MLSKVSKTGKFIKSKIRRDMLIISGYLVEKALLMSLLGVMTIGSFGFFKDTIEDRFEEEIELFSNFNDKSDYSPLAQEVGVSESEIELAEKMKESVTIEDIEKGASALEKLFDKISNAIKGVL